MDKTSNNSTYGRIPDILGFTVYEAIGVLEEEGIIVECIKNTNLINCETFENLRVVKVQVHKENRLVLIACTP